MNIIKLNKQQIEEINRGIYDPTPHQNQLVEFAQKFALNSYGLNLDFSTESINDVETILADIHKTGNVLDDETFMTVIALRFAAYIITTLEQNTEKGEWELYDPESGENSLPFYWRDMTLRPFMWCIKRMVNGEEDNIYAKYKTALWMSKDIKFGRLISELPLE